MIRDSENGVHIEAYKNGFAHITTKENGIGRSVDVDATEMKEVADMLYVVAEKMEQND